MNLKEQIKKAYEEADDKFEFLNSMSELLYSLSPEKENPVSRILWIDKENVVANNYNPNSVAAKEMELLYTSVREDGYTQPIVTVWDESVKKYVIIDGFHRNLIIRKYPDIDKRCHGKLPIVVLDKNIDQRMASTVRHNRARGSHSVDGMTNIVFTMLKDGCSEREICKKLGLEKKEFVKLMYITGFAKIFKNYQYNKAIDVILPSNKIEEHLKENDNEQHED